MKRILAVVAALTLLLAGLTACTPEPEEITWHLDAEIPIIAIDPSIGVYVETYVTNGTAGRKGGVVDYLYTRELATGGVREDLISRTYQRIARGETYPGSTVVTILKDALPDGSDARLKFWRCTSPAGYRCVMPDGQQMLAMYRVEVHVPASSVLRKTVVDDEG